MIVVAVGCGFLIALLYDLYWLAAAYKPRFWLTRLLQDGLFWLAVLVLVAAAWLSLTGGVLRLLAYLWLAVGGLLCRFTLSPRLRRLRKVPKLPPELMRSNIRKAQAAERAAAQAAQAEAEAEQAAQEEEPPITVVEELTPLGLLWQLPEKAMLEVGLGFWRGLGFVGKQAGLGKAWLAEHLPKPQPPPEDEEELAERENPPEDLDGPAGAEGDPLEQTLVFEAEAQPEPPDLADGPWQEVKTPLWRRPRGLGGKKPRRRR